MITLRVQGALMEVAERGAELRRLCTADGRERLWSGDQAVWGGVSPNLFPHIGRLRGDAINIEGKPYPMPKHGFARDLDFAPVKLGEDFVALRLTSTPRTRAVYPFDFELTIKHTLLPDGFRTDYVVQNQSDRPMPFSIGGHTGFRCPMNEGEAFGDYVLRFDEPEAGETTVCLPGGLMRDAERVPLAHGTELALSYDVFDRKDTLIFAGLKSRAVSLVHKDTGRGLRFAFPKFHTLAVWTMPGKQAPYVCLEPWNGLPPPAEGDNSLEGRPFGVKLESGMSYQCSYRMRAV